MDLISRQDAIDACMNGRCANVYDCVEAIGALPSAEPERHESPKNALYIRKADAIEICMEQIESPINTYFEKGTAEVIKKKITDLPSAEPEITRCKDCKWYDPKDESATYGYCHAIKHSHYSRHWEINIRRTYEADFYCADAERKEEEEEYE